MKAYPAYKESRVEWLGKIPEHWGVLRLKHVAIVNRQALTEQIDGDYELQYIDIGNVNQQGILNPPAKMRFADAPSRARRIIQQNDTIISTVRTYLKAVAFIESTEDNLIASTGFATLTAKEKIYPKFLYYLVSSQGFVDTVTAESTGVSYPAITATDLAQISAWLPSLREQQAIADFLDRKTRQIDTLIAKKQRQIELLQEQRTVLINQAVTKGLNPSAPLKDSGVEWLGEIPSHWYISKLKFLGKIRYGLGQPPRELENGVPIIRATNVERGKIVEKDMLYVDPSDVPSGRNPFLEENEIIVVRSGAYTADSAIITREYAGAIAGYDMIITPVSINANLLSYALLSQYVLKNQLYLERMRAAQPHLNAEELGETLIVYPPTSIEQTEIADYLDKQIKNFSETFARITKQIELLQEYRTALISEAVTGKIDVREAKT